MMPISTINQVNTTMTPPPSLASPATPPDAVPAGAWPEDTVDFSGMTVREAIAKVDEVRLDDIRRQISAGTYFTDEKLDYVADRVCEMLHQKGRVARGA